MREDGDHCGYVIRLACRSMGNGKLLLKMLTKKSTFGLDRLLITVQNHNTTSTKVAMANGGESEKVSVEKRYICIDCRL